METASASSRGVDAAEREAQKAREGATRLEAEVKRLSTNLADLNSSYRSHCSFVYPPTCLQHADGDLGNDLISSYD